MFIVLHRGINNTEIPNLTLFRLVDIIYMSFEGYSFPRLTFSVKAYKPNANGFSPHCSLQYLYSLMLLGHPVRNSSFLSAKESTACGMV